jgi:hypothetical protein
MAQWLFTGSKIDATLRVAQLSRLQEAAYRMVITRNAVAEQEREV